MFRYTSFMYTVIALGNKGDEYRNTRHNMAWLVCDEFVSQDHWQNNKYAQSVIANVRVDDTDVLFVKPHTYMNESGTVLPYLMKTYGTSLENLIVVQDEIDLPIGSIKISFDRGNGGHNGIKSIMEVLNSRDFVRIRVGISITGEDGVLHKPDVLGDFSKTDLEKIKVEISPKVKNIIEMIVEEGYEKAMNMYN